MTTMARWLPLLAIACTGKVEEDDSQPTGGDDSNTPTDDSATKDDTGEKVTKGDRWDGTYTGGWNLTFDKIDSVPDAGHCNGVVEITVAGKTIGVEVTTSLCDGVGATVYGKKPAATITNGSIVLDPSFPSNTGSADFLLDGPKEDCEFDFDWTFSDIENHPVQVTAEYELRSEEQFKEFYCAGAGYTFEMQAEQKKE